MEMSETCEMRKKSSRHWVKTKKRYIWEPRNAPHFDKFSAKRHHINQTVMYMASLSNALLSEVEWYEHNWFFEVPNSNELFRQLTTDGFA